MESLFLAVDILDKYLEKCPQQLDIEEFSRISLASFTMSIKYEEIYPPTFERVKSRMKLNIDFVEHVKT